MDCRVEPGNDGGKRAWRAASFGAGTALATHHSSEVALMKCDTSGGSGPTWNFRTAASTPDPRG